MKRLLGIFLALACCLVGRAEVKLFENNRWQGPIVIAQNAELDEWYAAQNLAEWSECVTGQRPEIFEESPNKKTPEVGVFVGRTLATISAKISAPSGPGETAIRTNIGGRVFLLGNNPTATRIAVGRFCEQHLGITFALPGIKGADWIPLREITLPSPDTFQPKFNWRSIGKFRSGPTQDWSYLVGYGDFPRCGHSLYEAFSEKSTCADPTLLADMGNGRITEFDNEFTPNPNLNHPKAAKIGAEYAFSYLEKNPSEFCAPLGVNDTVDFDRSSISEGWYRERPVRTDYLIKFLNRVAQEKWRPNDGAPHAIGTLAYIHTQRAPTIPAHPDIFPLVCADRIAYANRNFAIADAENLTAWKKSGVKNLGVYDYWHGLSQCVPRINFTAQALSIKTASGIGVNAWYAELGKPWAFDAPKAWLGAKLLVDPSADTEELLNKWFSSAYGPAAVPMREAYRVIESAWVRDAIKGGPNQWIRHFLDEDGTWVLGDSEITLINERLSEAAKAVSESPKSARLSNQQWRLEQFKNSWGLVLSFREIVRARQQSANSPEEAIAALRNLVSVERRFKEQQDAYNKDWGIIGPPIQWLEFIPTDPRAVWLEIIGQNKKLSVDAKKIVQDDVTGLSVLIDFWNQHKDQVVALSAPKDLDSFNKDWVIKLGGQQFSEVNYHVGLPRVSNDSGTISYKTPVKPGEILKFEVKLGDAGDQVQLGLRFNGQKKDLVRFVKYGPQSQSVIMMAPSGATEVKFEIVFKDNLNLTSLRASRLSLKP